MLLLLSRSSTSLFSLSLRARSSGYFPPSRVERRKKRKNSGPFLCQKKGVLFVIPRLLMSAKNIVGWSIGPAGRQAATRPVRDEASRITTSTLFSFYALNLKWSILRSSYSNVLTLVKPWSVESDIL